MREHGQRGRAVQGGRERRRRAAARWRAMVSSPAAQPLEDGGLALAAVREQGAHETRRLRHRPAMARPVARASSRSAQLGERGHVVAPSPRPAGRRCWSTTPSRGRPRTARSPAAARRRGGWRCGRASRPPSASSRRPRSVSPSCEHRGPARARGRALASRPACSSGDGGRGDPVRRAADDRRAGALLQRAGAGRVVAVGMGDHDVAHRLAREARQQRLAHGPRPPVRDR